MKMKMKILHTYKKLLLVSSTLLILIIVVTYLFLDFRGPAEINLNPDKVFGISCLRAHDLVVQEYDKNGDLWASRGMIIYKLKSGENKFMRIAHTPTGLSLYWLRNFSILRRITIRPECIEMVTTDKGDICALSAGRMWLLPSGEGEFKETFQLSHYGPGDQGIRHNGIISVNDSTVFFGEYFQNPDRNKVRIFKSKNNMSTWKEAYEFPHKYTRHIHAIQKDPYTDKLWVLTGDLNNECSIAWSNDEFNTIHTIGSGSQVWRACQLVFTEDAIYWGTDTSDGNVMGIYRWDKKTEELEKLDKLEGTGMFANRLKNGTIVLGINSDGNKMEIDDRTRLKIISGDGQIKSFVFGTRNHYYLNWWNKKYAQLRFQRDQGAASLAITCLNQKEFSDGELLIISEDDLLKVVEKR